MKFPLYRSILVVALCCAALFSLPACTSDQVAEFKAGAEQARAVSAALDQIISDLEVEIAATPDGDLKNTLQSSLDAAKLKKVQYDAIADDYLAKIENIEDPAQLVGEGMKGVAPILPHPWGLAVGLVGTLIASASEARRRRLKQDADDAFIAIEKSKDHTGKVDFEAQADELRSRMSTGARRLVEQAQNKAGPIVKAIPLRTEKLVTNN